MSYQPLARKYRPRKFSDLVGQEAATLALSNAIKLRREPHAVIFSGVRGIGKTTTARLYAKALNCQHGPSPEPCDDCESCHAINASHHEDVMEIDGASHNGVDEIRALQETIAYVPQRSSYKVYIIDEVHMLSTSAFNALLKTLEEPPSHVIFIFATTELQKVPQTVVGRCQTFYLKKMSLADTVARLRQILHWEQIPFEEQALPLVAKEGRGSMRDALTFLDQVVALGEGQVKLQVIQRVTAGLSSERFLQILSALAQRDGKACIQLSEDLEQAGVDFAEVVEATARLARHGFVVRDLGPDALDLGLLGLDDNELKTLLALAQSAKPFDLNRIFRTLLACKKELDGSELDRFVFENYCLEWCFDPGLPTLDEMAATAFSQSPQVSQSRPIANSAALPPVKNAAVAPVVKEAPSREFPPSWRDMVERWKKIKPLEARKLEELHLLSYSPAEIVVSVQEEGMLGASLLQKDSQKRLVEEMQKHFDFRGSLQVVAAKKGENPESLLQVREKEKAEKKQALETQAVEHPLTRACVEEFAGKILQVKIKESSL